jgi:hypothetical protein
MAFIGNLASKEPRPWLVGASALIIFLSFAIGRWGLWFFFPFPFLGADGFEYLELSREIQNGIFPSFHFIGAGYPLFISFAQIFNDGLIPIMLLQQLLSIALSLWLVYIFRKDVVMLLGATIFGIIYCTSDKLIRWEASIFPDSIMASGLLASAILVYYTLNSPRNLYSGLLGLLVFFLIAVRSSAVFLMPLVILLSLLLIWKRERIKGLVLIGSFSLALLGMSAYNAVFSLEQQFNFLTYGRMSKTHRYADGIRKNREAVAFSAPPKPKPLSRDEKEQVDSILRLIPDTAMLYYYLHSWDPQKYVRSMLHCRHPKFSQFSGNSDFQGVSL